jgi:hypothetical protein
MRHAFLTGALANVLLQSPVVPRMCILSSASHDNHGGIQQLTIGPQLHVDAGAVSLTVPVNVLPLMLTN